MGQQVIPGGHAGIGYGVFGALPLTEQARLLAYVRVKADPEGQNRKLKPAEALARLRSMRG